MDTVITERMDLFTSPLFLRAFLATLLGGILCGALGPFLLWRRLSMFSSSVSHAALTPLALSTALGVPTYILLYPFSALLAVGITRAEEKGIVESDSILSLFFSGFMAVGVLILVSSGIGSSEAVHFLFGDVLLISGKDLAGLLLVTLIVGGYVFKYKKDLVLLCLNRDLAVSEGVPVRHHIYILNLLAAITVVCLLGLVGIILTTSLIVGPALIASTFSKNLRTMFGLSLVMGVVSSCGGLIVSVLLDYSSGPTIAVFTLVGFLVSTLLSRR